MLNTTRFLLTEKEAGVAAADAPLLARIRQNFSRPLEEDIEGAVRRELAPLLGAVLREAQVAQFRDAVLGDEDVVRLDVAVHQSRLVGMLQRP